jgi:AraC family transcriptional regulator of adaptative response / DNA-3-methyladenine glycosylase II
LVTSGPITREFAGLVARARRTFDLDADPATIDDALGAAEPMRTLVAAARGLRLPGAFDPLETTVLAILGQGVSLRAATTLAGRVATRFGEAIDVGAASIERLFPSAEVLASAELSSVGVPHRKASAIRDVARLVADGAVDLEGSDPAAALRELATVEGIGPWTLGYLALRVFRDPDAELPGDAAVAAALRRLGLPSDRRTATRLAETWRPWRGYGYVRLWSQV